MPESQGVSLRPSDMTAGGLVGDIDALWKESRFAQWDYNGKVPQPVPAWKVVMEDVDTGEEFTQYFSMGSGKDWVPSNDGKRLVAVGTASTLKTGSNGALLMASLVNSGFPEDKIGDDISMFDGLVAHMERQPAPKRSGLPKREVAEGAEAREATVLVVTAIIKLPWEKASTKPAGAPATKKAAAKPKAAAKSAPASVAPVSVEVPEGGGDVGSSDAATAASEFVMGVLMENPDGVERKNLPSLAFKALAGLPTAVRAEACKLVYDEAFLSGEDKPWAYADGVVSMG